MKKGVWFLFLAIGGCGVQTMFTDIPAAASTLPEEYQKAKDLDLPLTAAELVAGVPEWNKESVGLLEAWAARSTANRKLQSTLDEMILAQNWKGAKAHLDANRDVMNLAASIANLPDGRMPRNYDLGPNVLFSEYVSYKSVAKLLCARALVNAHFNYQTGVLTDLRNARRLAVLPNRDPNLISALVSVAVEAIVNRSIQQITALWKANNEGLKELDALTQNLPKIVHLSHSLKGEVWMGIVAARNLDLFGGEKALTGPSEPMEDPVPPPDPAKLRKDGFPPDQSQKAYMARILMSWNNAWPTIAANDSDPIKQTKALTAEMKKVDEAKGASYRLSKLIFPVFEQAGLAVVRVDASNIVTHASVKVAQFALRNGRYPKSLAEAGILAKDPFGGDLKYKAGADGYRIWSVGPNFKDDNGRGPGYESASPQSAYDDVVAGFPAPQSKQIARLAVVAPPTPAASQ